MFHFLNSRLLVEIRPTLKVHQELSRLLVEIKPTLKVHQELSRLLVEIKPTLKVHQELSRLLVEIKPTPKFHQELKQALGGHLVDLLAESWCSPRKKPRLTCDLGCYVSKLYHLN